MPKNSWMINFRDSTLGSHYRVSLKTLISTLILCNTLQNTATLFDTLKHTHLWDPTVGSHILGIPLSGFITDTTWILCSTLQHTATHCKTLQHTATHCNILQHTAAHCSTLQHIATQTTLYSPWEEGMSKTVFYKITATHCNTLQHAATHCKTYYSLLSMRGGDVQDSFLQDHCNTLQYTAIHCNTLQHTATHYNTLQHTATHCNTDYSLLSMRGGDVQDNFVQDHQVAFFVMLLLQKYLCSARLVFSLFLRDKRHIAMWVCKNRVENMCAVCTLRGEAAGVLQCVVVWCSVMQCDAVWCSVVQCDAVCCTVSNVLHCVKCVAVRSVCCSVMCCSVLNVL